MTTSRRFIAIALLATSFAAPARAEPSTPGAEAHSRRWGLPFGLRADGQTYGFSASNPMTSSLFYQTLRLQLETPLGGRASSPVYAVFGARHCIPGKLGCVGVRALVHAHRSAYGFKGEEATIDAVIFEPALTPIDVKLPWRVKTPNHTVNHHDAIFGFGLSAGWQW